MRNPSTETEIAQTLEDVQVTLEVLVAHLGLEEQVQRAVGASRLKAERSRLEIERSLGHSVDVEGDSRR